MIGAWSRCISLHGINPYIFVKEIDGDLCYIHGQTDSGEFIEVRVGYKDLKKVRIEEDV